ncbi:TetR/AcrR family transcriptional regulator [Gryllotalpicola ginsengisoli]|uniref:TetR/AcrR family transcriptional regulator n=1 Tax=Gryllotalpicola ginsengisoli TaxID=444608 RepID=UPI0003B62A63|nr:TetR/AcrR family transcriptional regulator [Gryllotalpicola ginsengisoli]
MPTTTSPAPGGRARSFPRRAEQARRTRAAIVGAAAQLFTELGYQRTTMRGIAERAGVSVESVNLAGPKRALLAAAFEVTFAGEEGEHSLGEREAFQRIFAQADVGRVMDDYVHTVTEGIARSSAIWRAVRSAADADPEIAQMFHGMLERRRDDIRLAAGWLVERGVVEASALDETAATLSLLVAHETYEHLVGQFGWSQRAYRDWVRAGIQRLVLDGHGASVKRRRDRE